MAAKPSIENFGPQLKKCIQVGAENIIFHCSLTLYSMKMDYVTSTFLLVNSTVRSKQLLCFVQGQGQKTEQ